MGINGLLTDVRWEWTGTETTVDLLAGDTVLPVLDPESISVEESVWIADTGPYEILEVDVDADTFTITPGLEIDVDAQTAVANDVGGQPGRAWICEVILADADGPIEVPLTIHDLSVMPEGNYDPPVAIILADDLQSVEDLPGSLPIIPGEYIPPDSLPPGPQGVPGPPGQDGAPQYTWVKYADDANGTGMTDNPHDKAYMGLSYNHSTPTESNVPTDYQWSKVMGDPGPPAGVVDLTSNTQVLTQPAGGGVTVPATAVVTGTASNTTISVYEYSVDGTPFSGTVPTGVSRTGNVVTITGATMVAKSITVRMADAVGISDSLSVARVQEGAGGAPGPQGEPGVGVSGTTVTYQVGSSGTVAPTGAWVASPPATTTGQFLWTRTVTTYTDATTTTAYSVAAHGTPGLPGAPGRGIASTAVTYQIGPSGTSAPTGAWSPTPLATTPGDFLWTRTVTTYTDATTSTAYSVAAHGATGQPGAPGSPGNPGAPGVGVSHTDVTYQVGPSGTSAPTGAWSSTPQPTTPGTFLWTRTVTTYTDATTSTAYSVAAHGTTGLPGSPGAPGSDGSPGAPGVVVSSTAVTYQAGTSGTVAPTGTWVANPPATAPGEFLWTRTITTYTNSTTSTAFSVAAHGTTGNPGADAYTIVLSNEAHTFPGSPSAALGGGTTTVITALKGATPIPAAVSNVGITGAPTGMTTAVSGSPGTPTVTITVTPALTTVSGVLNIPVVVDGFTFAKTFSWSVSRQGSDGTPGPPGADGSPRYTWTKYADNATGAGFSDTPTATSKYLGMAYNKTSIVESSDWHDYEWSLIQGAPGPANPNTVYTGATPPWADGATGHPEAIWYNTQDPDVAVPFIWDTDRLIWVDVSDPKLDLLDDLTQAPVGDTTVGAIGAVAIGASNTADSARSLASTADGRVSFSDYDPTADDTTYYVENGDGSLARGTAWAILQAELVNGVAGLRVGDAGMTMNVGEYIIVAGLGFPFDGEHILDGFADTTRDVSNMALASGVATLTLAAAHPWVVGQHIIISGVDPILDGEVVLTGVTGTTLTYAVAGSPANIASQAAIGTASLYAVSYLIPNEANVAMHTAPDNAFGFDTIIQSRVEGSIWFTRTRNRRNLVTNPSFEVNTTGWSSVAATFARVDPTEVMVENTGTYVLRVTNSAAAGDHRVEWAGGSPGMPVNPAESYAATGYALLETGSGAGAFASVRFYTNLGAFIDEIEGQAVALSTTDWTELKVDCTVPDNAAFASMINLHNPNASAVWVVDAALAEAAEYTGRYFDGDSYDAVWGEDDPAHPGKKPGMGVPHTTFSTMFGGKIISVYELTDGGWVRLDFTGTTQYDGDASDLTQGILPAARIGEQSIAIGKSKTNIVKCSTAVTQGMFVNIWDNGGLFLVRPARADTPGAEAHGFVMQDAAVGVAVAVYTWGYNPYGLAQSPGPVFLSATQPGRATAAVPNVAGQFIQQIGMASDITTVHFNPQQPVLLY